MDLTALLGPITRVIELAAVAIMLFGLVYGSLGFVFRVLTGQRDERSFRRFRADVGRAILLGLEFLIAADIITTVTLELSLESLVTLAGIIAIRTLLSLSLEVEITGRWPWQQPHEEVHDCRQER